MSARSPRLFQGGGGGQLHGKHTGLGVFGLFQFLIGTPKALGRGARPQGVQLCKNLCGRRGALGQLWPMPGYWAPWPAKTKAILPIVSAPFSTGSAPSITSRTISAAGWIFVHHGGHLAGEEAPLLQIAFHHRLAQGAAAQGLQGLVVRCRRTRLWRSSGQSWSAGCARDAPGACR